MTALHYKASFERLGRGSGPFDATFDVPDGSPARVADDLAALIFRMAKKRLASKWFDVAVALDEDKKAGTFSVEAGRFGRGTLELLTEIRG